MNIDKAIKILQHKINQNVFQVDPDALVALKLGIEALKRVKWHKEQHISGYYEPLPGETPNPPPSDSLAKLPIKE